MHDKNKWDIQFLRVALCWAEMSKDPSKKVGSVIARGKYQLSQGYNGPPPGADDSQLRCDVWRRANAIHAEPNAITHAERLGIDIVGATLYSTLPCCLPCGYAIVRSGLVRVVAIDTSMGDPTFLARYSHDDTVNLFRSNAIDYQLYTPDQLRSASVHYVQ
jgi:dCMP deaminase